MNNKNSGLLTMFDEAQKQLDRQFKSSATLRDHAKTIIGVSSVVVSFFATFKIFDSITTKSNILVIGLFFAIALVYGTLMILAIKAAKPFSLESPINPRKIDYIKAYADKSEKVILSNQVTLYLRAIQQNENVIKEQHRLSNIVNYLLATIVVLIVFETILSIAL